MWPFGPSWIFVSSNRNNRLYGETDTTLAQSLDYRTGEAVPACFIRRSEMNEAIRMGTEAAQVINSVGNYFSHRVGDKAG